MLVGWCIIIYLIAIFPSNIYAAVQRIPFGGHSIGPRYLLVRLPLQGLLIGWTYLFTVKRFLNTSKFRKILSRLSISAWAKRLSREMTNQEK